MIALVWVAYGVVACLVCGAGCYRVQARIDAFRKKSPDKFLDSDGWWVLAVLGSLVWPAAVVIRVGMWIAREWAGLQAEIARADLTGEDS